VDFIPSPSAEFILNESEGLGIKSTMGLES